MHGRPLVSNALKITSVRKTKVIALKRKERFQVRK